MNTVPSPLPGTTWLRPLPQVPYTPQIADAQHMAEYLDEGRSLASDPCWQQSGAPTLESYVYWADRACGIACIKSIIEAFGGEARTLHAWIEQAQALGAYMIETDADGVPHEIGWKHAGLAQLCQEQGLAARTLAADAALIVRALSSGCLVIASVSYELGSADRPITRKNGHLVVITGALMRENEPTHFTIHNPSGRGKSMQVHANIPLPRFEQAYSGRVIVIARQPETLTLLGV